jgi:muconolactone delta-isomerase
MARGNNTAKRKDETDLQWRSRIAREKQAERDLQEPLVPKAAQRHGDYQDDTLYEVNDNGAVVRIAAKRNHGGCPLDRWSAANKLSMKQLAVISTCLRLWRLAGLNPRVTANYGERLAGGGNADHGAVNEVEAREDLRRLQSYVPAGYWGVWENIVRHGYAASEAGVGQGYVGKSAGHRAHLIVCFVADTIAMREGI